MEILLLELTKLGAQVCFNHFLLIYIPIGSSLYNFVIYLFIFLNVPGPKRLFL